MATSIIMPKAGMAMETGTIIEWNVSVGDRIEVGDEILEIETDKVAMPVEAETSGYLLATLAQPGDVVPVTETIGWIGEQGEAVPETEAPASSGQATAASSDQAATSQAEPASGDTPASGETPVAGDAPGGTARPGVEQIGDRVKATPAARRRSAELGVDLTQVTASGPDGDVRVRDVEAAAAPGSAAGTSAVGGAAAAPGRTAPVTAAAPGTTAGVTPLARQEAQRAGLSLDGVHGSGPGGRIQRRDVVEQAAVAAQSSPASGGIQPSATPAAALSGDTRTPLAGMRKVIAQRMSESHATMPPVTLNSVARMDALLDLRRQLNDGAEAAGRPKFSINDLLLAATAKAVRRAPWVNVSLDGTDVVQHQEINLGMAVALEQGLVVPVIHGADGLSLSQLAETTRDLGRRARERKLEVADLEGGTFTVTNLGMYGITTFTPIINPPQAAILGVGTVRTELELSEDQTVQQRSVMDLSLTADHRLVDGAQGALFAKEIVALLENPAQILV